MIIGNCPKKGDRLQLGKRYWKIGIGRDVCVDRWLTDGWRGFEFIIMKKYTEQPMGQAHPYLIRIAFAFWLPFYKF